MFFFQAEDGIRDHCVTGVQTCALPISIVGCSEGVRQSLQDRGFPAAKLLAISNGIRPEPYLQEPPPLLQRRPDIVMAARFARQKDHATLLRALVVLRQRGLTPTLTLAG